MSGVILRTGSISFGPTRLCWLSLALLCAAAYSRIPAWATLPTLPALMALAMGVAMWTYYWIVAPDGPSIEGYTLADGAFRVAACLAREESGCLPPFPDFTVVPASLVP